MNSQFKIHSLLRASWIISSLLLSPTSVTSTSLDIAPYCTIGNLKSGQLALRRTPGGEVIAGLNNGNIVFLYPRVQGNSRYIRVIVGPKSKITNLQGWINSNYFKECFNTSIKMNEEEDDD